MQALGQIVFVSGIPTIIRKYLLDQECQEKLQGRIFQIFKTQRKPSYLYTSYNIACPLINCIADFHIIDGAQKCIWLQNTASFYIDFKLNYVLSFRQKKLDIGNVTYFRKAVHWQRSSLGNNKYGTLRNSFSENKKKR